MASSIYFDKSSVLTCRSTVHLVYSKLSFKQFARKSFIRPRNARDDQQLLKKFDQEVSSLKRLSHQHLVSIIGSYTDQRIVAYLMEPIGDMNLYQYLCRPRSFIEERLPSLRSYFGCLANAVAYLHRQRIRHRDLKPQNILVRDHNVYITDFGTALDWSQRGRDTTNDPTTPFTEHYMAPEVANRSASSRNSSSDVWSLGVVFLDMVTVLRGGSIKDFRAFLTTHGTKHPCVWNNASVVTNDWFKQLRQNVSGPDSDNEPMMWIKDMLLPSPSDRPVSGALTRQIRNAAALGHFIGHCCGVDDDLEGYPSPPSSVYSEEALGLHLEDLPPQLDLDEKPFGSFVESSRQHSIESWLAGGSGQDDDILDITSEPPDMFDGDPIDVPYDIIEDDPTLTAMDLDQEAEETQSVISRKSKTLDICEGYDIIQDDSDDERSERGGQGYEIMEDSSCSESTARQASPPVSILANNDTPENKDDNDVGNSGDAVSAAAVRDVESELDRLVDDQVNDPPEIRFLERMEDGASQETLIVGGSLNAANLATLAKTETPPPVNERRRQRVKNMNRMLGEGPQISPSIYMQEVWDAASSAPTSVMSERTKKTFGGFGSALAWQDKTAHFLEKYVKSGKAAAVRELLAAGCNPGTRQKPRIRPLMLGVEGGSMRHNKCVAALLSAGANVNARERSGRTVLHYAIEHQEFHGYTNLIRDLLEAGADPNNKDKSGDYPILQILYGGYEPLEKHKRDALACLLQAEFATDVNIIHSGTGNMPLHLAVRRKDPWAVSMLLAKGAQVNKPNGSGSTPLMLAANSWTVKTSPAQYKVLEFLLDAGANVNERNDFCKTALHFAASNLCERAVELLIGKGADPDIKDVDGHQAVYFIDNPSGKAKKAPEAHAIIADMLGGSAG